MTTWPCWKCGVNKWCPCVCVCWSRRRSALVVLFRLSLQLSLAVNQSAFQRYLISTPRMLSFVHTTRTQQTFAHNVRKNNCEPEMSSQHIKHNFHNVACRMLWYLTQERQYVTPFCLYFQNACCTTNIKIPHAVIDKYVRHYLMSRQATLNWTRRLSRARARSSEDAVLFTRAHAPRKGPSWDHGARAESIARFHRCRCLRDAHRFALCRVIVLHIVFVFF